MKSFGLVGTPQSLLTLSCMPDNSAFCLSYLPLSKMGSLGWALPCSTSMPGILPTCQHVDLVWEPGRKPQRTLIKGSNGIKSAEILSGSHMEDELEWASLDAGRPNDTFKARLQAQTAGQDGWILEGQNWQDLYLAGFGNWCWDTEWGSVYDSFHRPGLGHT